MAFAVNETGRKIKALREEMARWNEKHPSTAELRPYGHDLRLRAMAIIGEDGKVIGTKIPGTKMKCQVKASKPFFTLDTHTTGSARSMYAIEKMPNGTNYPLPDGTIEIIEFFRGNIQTGEESEQAKKIRSAIHDATCIEETIKKGKVVFTLYPNGDVEDSHGLTNLPQNMTLGALVLTEMEKMAFKEPKLLIATS